MKKNSVKFLGKLSESFGPSGFEREAVRIVRDYVQDFSDEVSSDNLGSLLFKKQGTKTIGDMSVPRMSIAICSMLHKR